MVTKGSTNESGAVIFEAVIGLPLFVFVVFIAIQMMITAWIMLSVQFIATQTVRQIATGMCNVGRTIRYCDNSALRIAYADAFARNIAKGYGIASRDADDTNKFKICIAAAATPDTCLTDDDDNAAGIAGDLRSVRIEYESSFLAAGLALVNGSISITGARGATLRGYAMGRVEVRPFTDNQI